MYKILCICAVLLLLNSCAALVIGTATTAAITASKDESISSSIDDAKIWTKINKELVAHNLFKRVNVQVNNGQVLLTGDVHSPKQRIKTARISWQQEGVKEVINEITINSINDSSVKDYLLLAKIKANLLLKAKIKSVNYSIEVVNGVVYLAGIARTIDELNVVINTIQASEGVAKVVSYVKIVKKK